MEQLDNSVSRLKSHIIKSKSKQKAICEETVSQVASYLVFLKSSSISPDASAKLGGCLRKQLVPVYKAFPQPTLEFSAVLYRAIFDGKITGEGRAGRKEQKDLWESVLNALLSGILDFLDTNGNDKNKEFIGSTLYPTLCETLFSDSASNLGPNIRCTGYSVLSDSADTHKANQKRLRDDSLLGGARLSIAIWQARDYLCMEALLDVLARMIPPSGSTPSGRNARKSFIRSVFVDSSPDQCQIGETLADLVEHLKTPDWAETSAQIVDILASSNIEFPQPFKINTVSVDGQQKRSNRVFIDKTGFLANVLVEEDLFDSLSATYTGVLHVEISLRPTKSSNTKPPLCSAAITLDSPPLIGQEPVHQPAVEGGDAHSTISFAISKADVPRLQAALNSRGIGHTVKTSTTVKQSILASPAALEIDMAGNLIDRHEFDQRIENLSQLYGTNEPSDDSPMEQGPSSRNEILCIDPKLTIAPLADLLPYDRGESSTAGAALPEPRPDIIACPASGPEPVSAIVVSAAATATATVDSLSLPMDPPKTPIKRSYSQVMRDAVFGASDEELSEIECLPTPPRPRKSKSFSKDITAERVTRPPVKIRGRRILDSEDGSTPSRAPTTKRIVKKAVVVSDDEIEDVLHGRAPLVSRQRSMLLMTPVTSSTSRRRTIPTKASVNSNILPGQLETPEVPTEKNKPGVIKNAATKATTVDNLPGDLPAMEFASPDIKQSAPSVPGTKKAAQDTTKASLKQPELTFDDIIGHDPLEPVLVSAPGRKSVKAALRKKDQRIGEAASVPQISTPKRKRVPEDAPQEGDDGASRKRAKVANGDTSTKARKPPVNSPAGVPKQYGGRKANRLITPMSAQKNVDYDLIPGTSPITSQQQSAKKLPASDSKKSKKDPGTSKTKAAATKPSPKDKVKEALPKPKPKSKRGPKAREAVEVAPITAKRTTAKPVLEKVTSPSPRPLSPEPVDNFDEADQTMINHEHEDCKVVPAAEKQATTATSIVVVPSKSPSIARVKSNRVPWDNTTEPADHAEDFTICATEDAVGDVTLVDSAAKDGEQGEPRVEPVLPLDITPPGPVPHTISAGEPPEAILTLAREASSTAQDANCIDLTGPSPVKRYEEMYTPRKNTTTPTKPSLRPISDAPILHSTPHRTPRAKGNVTFASETFARRDSPLERDRIARPSTKSKPAFSPFRATTMASESVRPSPSSPGISDIASVLGEIQEAILHKITYNVDGVREGIRRGRERLLADAISDLVKMRAESIDCYNHLIELEAEYATFGRNLAHGLEDLAATNRNSQNEIQKAIERHDRGSIVKRMPASLLPASLPAGIKRLSK